MLKAKDAIVRAEEQTAVVPRNAAATQSGAESRLLVRMAVAVTIAEPDDTERRLLIAWAVDGDEDIAAWRDGHVPSRCGLAVFDEIGDDQRAKSWRQRDPGVIRITSDFANAPLVIRLSSIGRDRR